MSHFIQIQPKTPEIQYNRNQTSETLFGEIKMKLDGIGLFVNDMATMVR